MRIVILADCIEPQLGGAIGVAYQHAAGLAARGHQVTVVAGRGTAASDGRFTRHVFNLSIPERYRAYLGVSHPAAVRRVRPLLAQLKPDVVHAHNIYAALSYRCLAEARQVTPRVFLTAHDVQSFAYAKLTHPFPPANLRCPGRPNYRTPWWVNLKTARKRYNPFRNALIRRRLNRTTKVLAVSQALADALADNGITNVAVVRNGIDPRAWQPPAAAAVAEFRTRFQLAGRRVVLFSGRLSGAKGINQILPALAVVAAKVPTVQLLIAGDADGGLTAYRALPQRYGVADRVRFAGKLAAEQMQLAYHACDLVVVPSVCFDSFPSVNLEAMAAGKPVVATCFGGSREAVAEGATGYLINPYDVSAMAERITRLLLDQPLAQRFGQAGRRRVAEEFSSDRWLDQLETWYRR